MTLAYVSGGSNLDAEANLTLAARALRGRHPGTRFSRCYRNPAVGFEGPDFINFVAEVPVRGEPLLQKGRLGETYCVGGDSNLRNLEIIKILCAHLDRLAPANVPHAERISFVADRPGHDFRYSIDASKLANELGWAPRTDLAAGLEDTVRWYVENRAWWEAIRERGFESERLGLAKA